jgi:hypothetical protein
MNHALTVCLQWLRTSVPVLADDVPVPINRHERRVRNAMARRQTKRRAKAMAEKGSYGRGGYDG